MLKLFFLELIQSMFWVNTYIKMVFFFICCFKKWTENQQLCILLDNLTYERLEQKTFSMVVFVT